MGSGVNWVMAGVLPRSALEFQISGFAQDSKIGDPILFSAISGDEHFSANTSTIVCVGRAPGILGSGNLRALALMVITGQWPCMPD
jgi:hypothetical protein